LAENLFLKSPDGRGRGSIQGPAKWHCCCAILLLVIMSDLDTKIERMLINMHIHEAGRKNEYDEIKI
jgi:hypothetical protein